MAGTYEPWDWVEVSWTCRWKEKGREGKWEGMGSGGGGGRRIRAGAWLHESRVHRAALPTAGRQAGRQGSARQGGQQGAGSGRAERNRAGWAGQQGADRLDRATHRAVLVEVKADTGEALGNGILRQSRGNKLHQEVT